MDGMYGFHSTSGYAVTPENDLILPAENQSSVVDQSYNNWPYYGSDDLLSVAASVISDAVSMIPDRRQVVLPRRRGNRPCDRARNGGLDVVGDDDDDDGDTTIKERIASHPSYSKLLAAYIDCRKVGAPPEIACLLDDILLENDARRRSTVTASTCLGIDPELDDFMETYFHVLVKYKSDLARPFDEAAVFLGNIETQLRNLCKDEGGNVSSEEDFSGGETDNTQMSQELKHTLLQKFGGRIRSLKQEFTKKKKKGKLPKEARQKLLEWWNSHNKWPYPTEGDKISLAETTGLDPKQINNWFINQRKRHWKPSESMQAVMGALPGQHLYDD